MQPSSTSPTHRLTRERIVGILQAGLIVYIFLRFARIGLRAGFTNDDMFNLYEAWRKPLLHLLGDNLLFFSSGYRPLGALTYRAIFAIGGLNPLPFHAVVLGLMLLNLYLIYRAAAAVTTREIGILTALLLSFSASFVELYYDTGTIFDVLCFTFYFSAFALYADVRKQDRWLTRRQLILFLIFYICALNSKEMAVTLPPVILLYELVLGRPGSAPQAWVRRWTPLASTILITVPYLAGKLSASSPLVGNAAYRLDIGPQTYFASLAHYLSLLVQVRNVVTSRESIALVVLLLAMAVLARERWLLFACFFTLIAPLPILFVPLRGAYVMYIPAFGIALFLAAILILLRDRLHLRKSWSGPVRAVTFLLCAAVLIRFHGLHPLPPPPAGLIQPLLVQLAGLRARVQVPGRILFLEDPFGTDEWTPVFVCRLYFHDHNLVADRVKMLTVPPDQASYDVIFNYGPSGYVRARP
ncbi:MAG: hypothetical protein M3O35_05930 [Acidobacteriota bacterium]|nr:hypothetical protein [Acidobacteriota bacterium]